MEYDLLKIGAAYLRVSDERQDEYSPDSQLKKIREHAAKDGYMIPDEYVFYDDGISGKSVEKRADFNRMIAIAKEKEHPFDVIYVWKFSRFARNQEQAIVYKNLLLKEGISVKSVSEPIPDDVFGSLIERVIEWMDAFYLTNLSTEVQRGMEEKISRGEPVVPPPFGYKMGEKEYIPDEESGAADIVREIFQRFADGEKQRAIAMSLGQRGVRTKAGKKPENRWIDYILRNSCYIGKLRYSTNGIRAVSRKDYDNENIMEVDGNHKPLISIELWEEVQKLLDAQRMAYPKHSRSQQPANYILKGLLRCGDCGGPIAMSSQVSGKAKVRTMQCCNYSRGRCHTSHSITMPRIEAAVISGLKKAYEDKQFTINPKSTKKSEPNQVDYDKLIAVEERRLARAKEAYLAEIDTIEQYAQNKKEITERIATLKEMQSKETHRELDVNAFAKKVADIVELIEREDVSDELKNEALRTIIEKVVFDKAKGTLAIYFQEI